MCPRRRVDFCWGSFLALHFLLVKLQISWALSPWSWGWQSTNPGTLPTEATGPRYFCIFRHENVKKKAIKSHFNTELECSVLAGERGPSFTDDKQIQIGKFYIFGSSKESLPPRPQPSARAMQANQWTSKKVQKRLLKGSIDQLSHRSFHLFPWARYVVSGNWLYQIRMWRSSVWRSRVLNRTNAVALAVWGDYPSGTKGDFRKGFSRGVSGLNPLKDFPKGNISPVRVFYSSRHVKEIQWLCRGLGDIIYLLVVHCGLWHCWAMAWFVLCF